MRFFRSGNCGTQPGPGPGGGEQLHLSRLTHCGEFAKNVHLRLGAGQDDGTGFGGPEPGAFGELQPVLPRGLCKFVELAGLCGNAAVAEVADGGTDGVVVALDDGDGQAAGNSVGGVRQAYDSGTNNDDVGGLVFGAVGGSGGSAWVVHTIEIGC